MNNVNETDCSFRNEFSFVYLSRLTVLGMLAAFAAPIIQYGWSFPFHHTSGTINFAVSLGIFAIPFHTVAVYVLKCRPRSVLILLSAHGQSVCSFVILYKFIFSYSLIGQFHYNALQIYISFVLVFLILVLVDGILLAGYSFSGRWQRHTGILKDFVRPYVSILSVVALATLGAAVSHRNEAFIPRVKFSFLEASDEFDRADESYTIEKLSEAVFVPDAMGTASVTGFPEWIAVFGRSGSIYALIPDGDSFDQKEVLDLSGKIGTPEGELGMQGIAFGSKIEDTSKGRGLDLFVYYAFKDDSGIWNRLSRFDLYYKGGRFELSEEVVLVNQKDPSEMHNGGGLGFGSDGYLYISLGDGGPVNDVSKKSQLIRESLFSGILRIAVYEGEGLKPIENQPINGSTQNYLIPKSNPFVGVTDALEEFWALGLRNPFRMHVSKVTDEVWVTDVGQVYYEEVNIAESGANFGWSYREGPFSYELSRFKGEKPSPYWGHEKKPLFSYSHQGGRVAIIGGTLYFGSEMPSIDGAYVFSDYLSGEIFALERESRGAVNRAVLLFSGILGKSKINQWTSVNQVGDLVLLTRLGSGTDGNTIYVLKQQEDSNS